MGIADTRVGIRAARGEREIRRGKERDCSAVGCFGRRRGDKEGEKGAYLTVLDNQVCRIPVRNGI